MKQDKILAIVFSIIGLYLLVNAVFLFTLDIEIAPICAIVLIILALVFIGFAIKFMKLSKVSVVLHESDEVSIDEVVEEDIIEIQENEADKTEEIVEAKETEESKPEQACEIIQQDDEEEHESQNVEQNQPKEEAVSEKQRILNELEDLKKQLNQASVLKIVFDDNAKQMTLNKFIAVDLETTGFDKMEDRIIEIGAVLFEAGKVLNSFNTLVNPQMNIPGDASAVNHITDAMVANAPSEKEACTALLDFMQDAVNGSIFVCAHNADFDMGFLEEAFKRNNLNPKLYYADTLQISRDYIPGLTNYQLNTVAQFFSIENKDAHRASSDAEVCGKILYSIVSAAR